MPVTSLSEVLATVQIALPGVAGPVAGRGEPALALDDGVGVGAASAPEAGPRAETIMTAETPRTAETLRNEGG
jgi:hypothetical protein